MTPVTSLSLTAPKPSSLAASAARALDGDYKTPGPGHTVKDGDGDYKPAPKPGTTLAAPPAAATLDAALSLPKGG